MNCLLWAVVPRLLGLVLIAWCGLAFPASGEEFFAGRTVTLLVGYAAGGGYDLNGRLLARHLGAHLPGHPTVVVQNMPGAGSLRSLQYLQTTAPRDGTVLDLFDFTQITNSLLKPAEVPIDFRAFGWVGSIAQDLAVCYVWKTLGATTLDQLRALKQVNMGRTNPGSSSDIEQNILHKIFGVNVRSVSGYAGSAEAALAVERGELDGGCLTWSSLPPAWSAGHRIVPILKLSSATAPDLPPDLPNALDIAPDDTSRRMIELLTAAGELGKPVVVHPSVPPKVLDILQRGFQETMIDPGFLADAASQKLPVGAKSARQAQDILSRLYAVPADIAARARSIVSE